ncbi:MAG TPA: M24 family metallopeptidase [Gaiellaceae bacterium]
MGFSSGEFKRRWEAVRQIMRAADVDVLLAFGSRGAAHEVQYLSGYPVSGEAVLIFPVEGDPTLLVDYENHVPDARRLSVVEDVRARGEDAIGAALAVLREKARTGSVGVAGPLNFQRHAAMSGAVGAAPADLGKQLAQLRLIKSAEEMEMIRTGAALSDAALLALRREGRPGLSEHDLVAIVEASYLPEGGATHIHYLGATSMADPDLCVPRQFATGRKLKAGDVILTELSAASGGYYGQVLRTLTVAAEPTLEYSRLHELALAVYDEICNTIRPGASSETILDIAEKIHDAGLTVYDDLVHCAVGGVYAPFLRTRRTTRGAGHRFTFEEDMVIVVQPNVVTPDHRMGVQVGDMLRVTARGVERLHSVPREILLCG